MAMVAPTAEFLSPVEDSRRWAHVTLRSDDIVIATPPKCGTTWTQGIVASLLRHEGDDPLPRPWPDWRLAPLDEMVEALDAQSGRRFIKSHCPADALPYDDQVRYVLVYRDPADALVSWGNHRTRLFPEIVAELNDAASVDGLSPIPERFDGEYDVLFDEWSRFWSPALHLSRSVHLAGAPNVLFLHYADLDADLSGQMRRIAEFLEIPIDPERFPDQVAGCALSEMREASRGGGLDRAFDGGVDAFFFRGGSGRGRELLTDDQLARVREHTAALVDPTYVGWLEKGDRP